MYRSNHTSSATLAALRVALGPGLQAGGVSDRTLRTVVAGSLASAR